MKKIGSGRLQLVILIILFLLTSGRVSAQEQREYEPEIYKSSEYTKTEAARLLTEYLKIQSLSGIEEEAGDFLSAYCEQQGLYVTTLPADSTGYNFAATIYPLSEDKPVIWLQHHMDVVPAGTTDEWDYPPFSGVVVNDTIWGRGAIDNKGPGIMQLMSLLNIKGAADTIEFIYNVGVLCFSSEESGGGAGAKYVLDRKLSELNPLVAFGEGGAALRGVLLSAPEKPVVGISVAEKAVLWLKLDLQLNSYGHGAAPAPEYANKLMIYALSRLEGRKFNMEFNRVNRRMFRRLGRAEGGLRGFLIGHINWWILSPFVKNVVQRDPLLESLTTNTITVTKLENPPGPHNKISIISTAYLDCRLQPNTTVKAFIRRLERILDEPKIKITVINSSPESKPSPVNDFYDAMAWAVQQEIPDAAVIPILFPATTDNIFFRNNEVPTYGLIPAMMSEDLIKSVHSINERLPVAALEQGINIYTNMILRIQTEGAHKRRRLLNAELRKVNLLEE
ncbi:peptidase m20 [Flammeovirgaceae bacterium 311]|nr:peptidase m20 [Flammeovirgaceae bacterium 311]